MLKNWLRGFLLDIIGDEAARAGEEIIRRREYVRGNQPAQLRVRPGAPDDNLVINLCSLLVSRAAHALAGGGVNISLGDGDESAAADWLDECLRANDFGALLYDTATWGAEAGTCFWMILPPVAEGEYPRLSLVDPAVITIETEPDDWRRVVGYTIQYARDDTAIRRRIVRGEGVWEIVDEQWQGGRWVQTGAAVWQRPYAPIVHWKNLPDPSGPYGAPDLTPDLLALQDRINREASNISKIIRTQAHPARWAKNVGQVANVDFGPDRLPVFGPQAEINQLPPVADISGALAHIGFLRQAFFAAGREVDLDSLADKLGSLTNFGLRVLYADMLSKLAVKRGLYGDGIAHACRALLDVGGQGEHEVKVAWPADPLPRNEAEQMAALEREISLGLVSRETAATERGRDWAQERERIEAERPPDVGAMLLEQMTGGNGAA